MKTFYTLVNSLHSIYMDGPSFRGSVEKGISNSTMLPDSGNIIVGKCVPVRNFSKDIGYAYVMDVGIKAALEYNPRSTTNLKGDRASTRMRAITMLTFLGELLHIISFGEIFEAKLIIYHNNLKCHDGSIFPDFRLWTAQRIDDLISFHTMNIKK